MLCMLNLTYNMLVGFGMLNQSIYSYIQTYKINIGYIGVFSLLLSNFINSMFFHVGRFPLWEVTFKSTYVQPGSRSCSSTPRMPATRMTCFTCLDFRNSNLNLHGCPWCKGATPNIPTWTDFSFCELLEDVFFFHWVDLSGQSASHFPLKKRYKLFEKKQQSRSPAVGKRIWQWTWQNWNCTDFLGQCQFFESKIPKSLRLVR